MQDAVRLQDLEEMIVRKEKQHKERKIKNIYKNGNKIKKKKM
jgi:hypothetical protein